MCQREMKTRCVKLAPHRQPCCVPCKRQWSLKKQAQSRAKLDLEKAEKEKNERKERRDRKEKEDEEERANELVHQRRLELSEKRRVAEDLERLTSAEFRRANHKMSGYDVYVEQFTPVVAAANPTAQTRAVREILDMKWRCMSEFAKLPYMTKMARQHVVHRLTQPAARK